MSLSRTEVEHIATLARLRLTPEETDRYRTQLSAVLDYIAKLNTVDTRAIEPTASVLPLRSVLRADVVTPSLAPATLFANAPASEADTFVVPPVLE